VIEIGKYNLVKVISKSGKGYDLEDRDGERIFLPEFEIDYEIEPEEELEVFAYRNSHDDLVASAFEATVLLGEFGYVQVKSNSNFGSFLNWGVNKDLLAPFNQQKSPMVVEGWYIVYCYLDERYNKLAASSKIDGYLKEHRDELSEGQKVEIMVIDESDLGVNVIVNNTYRGLIFHNENFQDLHTGDVKAAYVKTVREDGKLDIRLTQVGTVGLDNDSQFLLKALRDSDGYLALTDKSDPQVISEELEMSKKAFKRAVGALYKQRLITLEDKGIRIV
jgi:predicted RNA-binding protein (virulence factor B family)